MGPVWPKVMITVHILSKIPTVHAGNGGYGHGHGGRIEPVTLGLKGPCSAN